MKPLVLIALLGAALVGCSSGSEATVTQSDEEKFKHPAPFDPSTIPKDAMNRPGPHFVGTPSGASNPSGAAPQIQPRGG